MARKKSPNLTEAELRLMEILWEKGPLTVGQVVEALPRKVSLAYNTVLTTLRILETKGYLSHSKDGRAFIYKPLIDRSEAVGNVLSYIIEKFFNKSAEQLVLRVLEDQKVDQHELERLTRLIAKGKQENQ